MMGDLIAVDAVGAAIAGHAAKQRFHLCRRRLRSPGLAAAAPHGEHQHAPVGAVVDVADRVGPKKLGLVPEAISSRTAVMSFQVPRRCWRVESLDMRQSLTRRRDGAKCVWGEKGKVRRGGRSPRREGWSHQGRQPPTGKAPRSNNSAETPKWPLAPTTLRAPR